MCLLSFLTLNNNTKYKRYFVLQARLNISYWSIDVIFSGKDEIMRREEPFFVEQVPNITVTAGKDATLSCQVDNLNQYKVS